jgi:hypothetical protein
VSKCEKCDISIPTEQLSGLNTCPKCVTAWIKEYKSYHDRRYGKRERERVMHTHNFKATDIPGVCLCKCGAETYYVSESQSYYVSVEGE